MDQQRRIGRYQVLEEVASGGQATVYRAWDTTTGQVVALKVLHPHLSRETTYLERFHREARFAASIADSNVIRIFEVGDEGDTHFISMEYLALSVHDLIEAQGQLPLERAVDICRQTALALESAHRLSIVHRDIKPQNILLAPDGTIKVSDFGIARAAELSTMTRTGALMGTPHYMAPEQAQGKRADAQSDLYSLGVVLYQMLTGEVPFDADTPWEVIRQHIEAQPKNVRQVRSDVPKALERVVSQCLEKDPRRRFKDVEEFRAALDRAVPQMARARPQAAPSARQEPAIVQPHPASSKRRVERNAEPVEPPASDRSPAPHRVSRLRRLTYVVSLSALAILIAAATLPNLWETPPSEPERVKSPGARVVRIAAGESSDGVVDEKSVGANDTPGASNGSGREPADGLMAVDTKGAVEPGTSVDGGRGGVGPQGASPVKSQQGQSGGSNGAAALAAVGAGEPTGILLARAVLADSYVAMQDVGSFHFEGLGGAVVETDTGAAESMGWGFSGDFMAPDRSQGVLFGQFPGLDGQTEVISIGDTTYARDATGEWRVDEGTSLAIPRVDLEIAPSLIRDVAYLGEEIVDGVAVHHLVGTAPMQVLEGSAAGGEVQIELWVQVEDALLRRLKFSGEFWDGSIGAFSWTIGYSDFNAHLVIEAPTTAVAETLVRSGAKAVAGDWIITEEESYEDTEIEVSGRIVIAASGSLRLVESSLMFDAAALASDPRVIEVLGGALFFQNSDIRMSGGEKDGGYPRPIISAAGGAVSLVGVDIPLSFMLRAKDTAVEIIDSSLEAPKSRVEIDGGTLRIERSQVFEAGVLDGALKIVDSQLEWVEYRPASELSVVDSKISVLVLDLPREGRFLLTNLGQSNGDAPRIGDLDTGEDAALTLTRSPVDQWSVVANGGHVTIEDSSVGYLLSQNGSMVVFDNGHVDRWDVRGSAEVVRSRVDRLTFSGDASAFVAANLFQTDIGVLKAVGFGSEDRIEVDILCGECRIDEAILLERADVHIGGGIEFQTSLANVTWESANVTRSYRVAVSDEQGVPLAGVQVEAITVNTSSGVRLAKVAGGMTDESGETVLSLDFGDGDWSRQYRLVASLAAQVVGDTLSLFSPSPIFLSMSASDMAVADPAGPEPEPADGAPEEPDDEASEEHEGADHIAGTSSILVRALIDGRSLLMVRGNTAQWLHLEAAAPGRHEGVFDTYVNGDSWSPSWPDATDTENRNCRCVSSVYESREPLLPAGETVLGIELIQARGDVLILDRPTGQNDYTVIVEFNDTPGGSDWYEMRIVLGSLAAPSTVVGLTKGATISGVVTDPQTGRPISNVNIEAQNVRDGGRNSYTDTNGRGAYVLEGIAPGSYRIRAQAAEKGYIEQYFDGRPGWEEATLVTVEGSESIGDVDFALDLGATISGKVVDAVTGLPVFDIRVKASDDHRGYYADSRTDYNGGYTLRGIAPGAYRVETRGQDRGYVDELYDDELVWDQADLVIVRDDSSVGGIDFALVRGATISGTVTDADTGLPLRDVGIDADAVRDGPHSYTETSADGSYVLEGVAPGTYTIRASTQDGRGYVRAYYDESSRRRGADVVTVAGSEAIEGIDFGLKLGAVISGRAQTRTPVFPCPICKSGPRTPIGTSRTTMAAQALTAGTACWAWPPGPTAW